MELRKLKSEDMFTMFSIMSKIGFKDLKEIMTPEKMQDIASTLKNDESDEDSTTMLGMMVMMDIASIVIKNLPSCKADIYQLLSDLSGMKVKDIANLDMVVFTEMIISVFKKEEFKDFFKVVSGLFR